MSSHFAGWWLLFPPQICVVHHRSVSSHHRSAMSHHRAFLHQCASIALLSFVFRCHCCATFCLLGAPSLLASAFLRGWSHLLPRFCIFSRRPSSSPLLRNHCNACAARPRTCLVPLPSSPRVLLHVDARATIPDQETDRVCTSGYIIGKKEQRQLRTTHKCTIMKYTILLIKHNHSITPTFTVMNPLLRLSYGQCSSIPNPLLRPSPSQCGSPPSSNSPSTNPNQI